MTPVAIQTAKTKQKVSRKIIIPPRYRSFPESTADEAIRKTQASTQIRVTPHENPMTNMSDGR